MCIKSQETKHVQHLWEFLEHSPTARASYQVIFVSSEEAPERLAFITDAEMQEAILAYFHELGADFSNAGFDKNREYAPPCPTIITDLNDPIASAIVTIDRTPPDAPVPDTITVPIPV
ncbi:hypothetical protein AVEN_99161-1 [Araneus ventricosus]|uniref:Uncharacterized protein n=1 Tax=Araneus ventricosus TaxID=182803 RepID=A0A4Y2CKY6_ARAVE|nr:hypothetical protein AVEN_99161-1 [Araneus ventricosus]